MGLKKVTAAQGRFPQQQAPNVSPLGASGNPLIHAAVDESRHPVLPGQNEGMLRLKPGIFRQGLPEPLPVQRGVAVLLSGGAPQLPQLLLIPGFIVAYHMAYPFTAPMVTPSIKYFCRAKNSTNMGRAEMVAPAIMGENRVSLANLNCFSPT